MNCKNMKTFTLWLAILNYCICLSLCFEDDCKGKKYSVKDENKNYCIECRTCSANQTSLHYQACKEKNPQHIPGQGHAWCTAADKFPLPYCSRWDVSNGHINCSNQNYIMSKCNVICSSGYKIVNDQIVACTEELLQWNVSESLRPSCNRTDPPGVPIISSSALDSKVKVGTTVTLRCKNTTELVGRAQYIWKFNNNDLYYPQSSYQLGSVTKTDEGSYRCVIKDELGESHPTEYKLEVEEVSFLPDVENKKLLYAILTVVIAVVMTGILFMVICCRNYLKEKIKMICFGNRSGRIMDHNTTNSNDHSTNARSFELREITNYCCLQDQHSPSLNRSESPLLKPRNLNTVNEAKAASHHETAYISMPDGDRKVFSTVSGICCLQDQQSPSLDNSDSPLLKPCDLTETANSNQRALKEMMNNKEIMKEIKKIMDQIPDSNNENPTYRDLAKFLGMDVNAIRNFEFFCKRDGQSPTENLLHDMKANGDGLDKLNLFLQRFQVFDNIRKQFYH